MSFFTRLFSISNKNNSKNNAKKSKKKKKGTESALYFNTNKQKYRILDKNEYTVTEFMVRFGKTQPKFKNIVKANVIIMYDPDAPAGEGVRGNKTYIHYLQVDGKDIIKYRPPNPVSGSHNYVSVSLKIDDPEVLKKLSGLDYEERKPDELQELHSKYKLFGLVINKSNILRITKFKLVPDKSKNNNNKKNSNKKNTNKNNNSNKNNNNKKNSNKKNTNKNNNSNKNNNNNKDFKKMNNNKNNNSTTMNNNMNNNSN